MPKTFGHVVKANVHDHLVAMLIPAGAAAAMQLQGYEQRPKFTSYDPKPNAQ
jgi:hypothetical protein